MYVCSGVHQGTGLSLHEPAHYCYPYLMNTAQMIVELDKEMARLKQARDVLAGSSATEPKRGPGRPRKSAAGVAKPAKSAKRKLSPEGRAKIAEAQRKRHAAAKGK